MLGGLDYHSISVAIKRAFATFATNPFVDTNPIAIGSVDETKKVRLEVDGLTTGVTRVLTVRDANFDVGGATTAETKAGSISTASVTPTGLLAALGFSAAYDSGNQTITSAGSLTLAHGLGRKPILLQVVLKCLTADQGYSVGDELFCPSFNDNGTSANGVSVVPDATNLSVRYSSGASVWVVPQKATGARAGITNGSWAQIFRAWA